MSRRPFPLALPAVSANVLRRLPALCLLAGLGASSGLAQQRPDYDTVSVVPKLSLLQSRIASGDFNGDGRDDLFVSGLDLKSRRPITYLLPVTSTRTEMISNGKASLHYATYGLSIDPLGAIWGGDVLAHDLDASGTADLLLIGSRDSTGLGRPASAVALQTSGALRPTTLVPLPALSLSRLAASGRYVAATGRPATGPPVLQILRRTAETGAAHTVVASFPGVELGGLAFGDCDGDGDDDLFATGRDGNGGTAARLYRNDAGTFVASPLDLPGVFLADAVMEDLDRDGDDDLVYGGSLFGPSGLEGLTRVYQSQGCAFSAVAIPEEVRHMRLSAVVFSGLSWAIELIGRRPSLTSERITLGAGDFPQLNLNSVVPVPDDSDAVWTDPQGDGVKALFFVGTRTRRFSRDAPALPFTLLFRD